MTENDHLNTNNGTRNLVLLQFAHDVILRVTSLRTNRRHIICIQREPVILLSTSNQGSNTTPPTYYVNFLHNN